MSAVDAAARPAVAVVRRVRARTRRHHRLVCGGLLAALLCAVAARVLLGDYLVTVPDFVRIVGGEQIPGASFIVMESKLPRAVVGVLAGVAFGLGGALFQQELRNPLASPDLIGIAAGASTGAVVAIVLAGLHGGWVSLAGIAGALAVAVAILLCAGLGGGHRIVLVGVAFSAGLVSVIQYVFARANVFAAQEALTWLTGSLNQVAWPAIGWLALAVAVLLLALIPAARALAPGALGPDTASGLGVPPSRLVPLLLVGVLLVATATAATGPIAFVALLSGPIARWLNRGRPTLVGAALTGALLVVAADYAAAYALPGVNLPVGVVTGAVGAPFLLWLLVQGPSDRRTA